MVSPVCSFSGRVDVGSGLVQMGWKFRFIQ